MQISLAIDNSLANPSAVRTPLAFWRLEWRIFSGLSSRATSSYQSLQPPPPSSSSFSSPPPPPPLPCCHGYTPLISGNEKREVERRVREGERVKWGKREDVCGDDDDDDESAAGGRSAGGMAGSVRENRGWARAANKHERRSPMFSHFATTNPRWILSVPLSSVKTYIYPSQIRTALTANLLRELFLDAFWSGGFTSSLQSRL